MHSVAHISYGIQIRAAGGQKQESNNMWVSLLWKRVTSMVEGSNEFKKTKILYACLWKLCAWICNAFGIPACRFIVLVLFLNIEMQSLIYTPLLVPEFLLVSIGEWWYLLKPSIFTFLLIHDSLNNRLLISDGRHNIDCWWRPFE
jgi:hypothetical protein